MGVKHLVLRLVCDGVCHLCGVDGLAYLLVGVFVDSGDDEKAVDLGFVHQERFFPL